MPPLGKTQPTKLIIGNTFPGGAPETDVNTFSSPDPPLTPDVADTKWGEIDAQAALDYDANTETYRASIGWRNGSVALDVAAAVATVSNTPPLELPPLYDDINPDAVDALAELTRPDAAMRATLVAMTYDGHEVMVHGDGVFAIRPPPAEAPEGR